MSTKWASLEIADARNQRSTQGWRRFENEEYIRALEEENKAKDSQIGELKARLKHQHQQKFKANKKPKKRPSGKPPRKPRKRGPPAGHSAWTRKIPDRVDQTVHVDAPDYNAIHPAGRQACLAHIKHKADDVAERIEMLPKKNRDPDSLRFCRALSRFLSYCCRIGHRRNTGELAFERAKKLISRHSTPRKSTRIPLNCYLILVPEKSEY
jgi:hypothetical protein